MLKDARNVENKKYHVTAPNIPDQQSHGLANGQVMQSVVSLDGGLGGLTARAG